MLDALPFPEVWLVDFEFDSKRGENPEPVCLVALELRSGRQERLWRDQFGLSPPYPTGPEALFVAYYASAEISCHLALGWPAPERILDLFIEFRNHTNGLPTIGGNNLLGALAHFGLDSIGATEKEDMRNLVLRGGPWSDAERAAVLDYCESDVAALARLLPAMLPGIDLPRALLRGRYMAAAARMEHNGVPIDTATLERLQRHWSDIQGQLITDIDRDYGVFEGRTFKAERFAAWLARTNTPWPRLESGRLDMSDDVFREMSRGRPAVAPLRELRSALSSMRLADLAVGRDGRNRTMLSAFRARSGRNQPSNSRFIFGPSVWLRGLIKPPPDHGLAHVDWTQQEFGIAAALSGDRLMIDAYRSGDPYLAFAKQVGAVPTDATAFTHKDIRQQFKSTVLAVQYGMEAETLAHRIGQPPIRARDLLRAHREAYPIFWRWSDGVVDRAMLMGELRTVFGWRIRTPPDPNTRTYRNFVMQSNGAEMLRLTCCLATERGIEVCAPVHDAVLICAPLDRLDADVVRTQNAMREASRVVLNGFELGTDADIIRYPDRYEDERGAIMWAKVMRLLDRFSSCPPSGPSRSKYRTGELSAGSENQSMGVRATDKGPPPAISPDAGTPQDYPTRLPPKDMPPSIPLHRTKERKISKELLPSISPTALPHGTTPVRVRQTNISGDRLGLGLPAPSTQRRHCLDPRDRQRVGRTLAYRPFPG
jgi:DNA polymerase-1